MLSDKKNTITNGASPIVNKNKKDDYSECGCKIVSVLSGRELEFIKNLFRMVEKKEPEGELLGLIDDKQTTQTTQTYECPFKFSWGDGHYCSRQEYVARF